MFDLVLVNLTGGNVFSERKETKQECTERFLIVEEHLNFHIALIIDFTNGKVVQSLFRNDMVYDLQKTETCECDYHTASRKIWRAVELQDKISLDTAVAMAQADEAGPRN